MCSQAGEMTAAAHERQLRWVTEWGAQLGGAVWISGPDRRLLYVNPRAEKLLGARSADLLGQRCDRVFAATAQSRAFCAPECPILRLARAHAEIPSVDLRVARPGSAPPWIRLIAFGFGGTPQKDPYLVECGLCLETERAVLEFMHRIAGRSQAGVAGVGGAAAAAGAATAAAAGAAAAAPSPFRPVCQRVDELSPRLRQILDLLTADHSHEQIAAELRVRPVTVRNHIQHLLTKLGVHSILEAVALNLMHEGDALAAQSPTTTVRGGVRAGW